MRFASLVTIVLFGSVCSAAAVEATETLSGSHWKLRAYGLVDVWREVPDDVKITISFTDGQLNGLAGCNRYLGSYVEQADMLSIETGGVTLAICPDAIMVEEELYLAELEKIVSYTREDNSLLLNFKDGITFMSFIRLPSNE